MKLQTSHRRVTAIKNERMPSARLLHCFQNDSHPQKPLSIGNCLGPKITPGIGQHECPLPRVMMSSASANPNAMHITGLGNGSLVLFVLASLLHDS